MNIKKIELVSNGFKGASITYLKQDFKNNRPFINEIIEKRKNPIHKDMEDLFKDLRIHLLDICKLNNIRLSDAERNSLVLETEVTSIEFDNDSYVIIGETEVFDDKHIKLKTCKVQDGDYENNEEVRSIIERLKIEATSYMDGLKVVSDREMALRWLEAKKDQDGIAKFESMTEDEQKDFINKTFKYQSDIDEDDSEVDFIDANDINTTDDVIDVDAVSAHLPEPTKGKGKKKVEQEEGGF